ncbi:chemotaxis protein CheC [Terrilactibacillus laevilacticus]|uniref:Chemotaxis protein CheC n=2 Tax=Terrilactibacillus laevilacticus TaxID=1380157 RepID=A0ABW5PPS2_9BACI|nr:chemotaxis protein CheC [Terrilactibacillus laevilacticus]
MNPNRQSFLEDLRLDILKEIGNIGAAHAATSLSTLLNKRIDLKIPSAQVVPISEVNGPKRENNVAATYTYIDGDIQGHFFMLFKEEHANTLVSNIIPDTTIYDGDLGESAFCEIGNILCGSYLSALSKFLNITINQSPPILSIDIAAAILGEGLIELSMESDSVIMIETVLDDKINHHQMDGELVFLPNPDSMDLIFKLALGGE